MGQPGPYAFLVPCHTPIRQCPVDLQRQWRSNNKGHEQPQLRLETQRLRLIWCCIKNSIQRQTITSNGIPPAMNHIPCHAFTKRFFFMFYRENVRKGGRSHTDVCKCTATWQTLAAHRHTTSFKTTPKPCAPERVWRQGCTNFRRKKTSVSAGFLHSYTVV